MHLVGFITRIYHEVRSSERQFLYLTRSKYCVKIVRNSQESNASKLKTPVLFRELIVVCGVWPPHSRAAQSNGLWSCVAGDVVRDVSKDCDIIFVISQWAEAGACTNTRLIRVRGNFAVHFYTIWKLL